MKCKRFGSALFMTMSLALTVTVTVATAGVMPVGALIGSTNATVDGQATLPHTTLLSGDSLQVKNGMAMVTLDQGNRMVLGRQTEASFLRDAEAVTVSLKQGTLALYHPQAGSAFRVKAGNVTVAPAKGYQTMGEIAMADGSLVVMAKDGALEVENHGSTQEVSKGKTITITAPAGSAPVPVPPGRRHLKHINKKLLLYLAIGAAAGGVAWAVISSGGGQTPVSPVTPAP